MSQDEFNPYLSLIDLILSNPKEREIDILNAHRKLINSEFVNYLMLTAEEFKKRDRIETTRRLLDLANKLLKIQTTSIAPYNREEYFKLLINVLQKVSEGSSPQSIYKLLQKNQSKLDRNFINLLEYWANETLLSVGSQQKIAIANDLVNFANLISEFNTGNRIINLDIAIVAYQTALTVYQPTTYPKNWAIVNTNLANAWRDRGIYNATTTGIDIETAISLYDLASEIITKEKYAYAWGNLQRNLGIAYLYRQEKNKSKNLEIAIAYYKKALTVHTLAEFPQEWAASNNNLGDVYLKRFWGEPEDNIEMAIAYLEKALKIYTLKSFPHNWATIQNNLGNAFQTRIRGDKSENMETAISYYQNALSIHTLEDYPYSWAMLNNNLAGAYRDRHKGNKRGNERKAISCLKKAATVFTKENFPQQWADIQHNINNIING